MPHFTVIHQGDIPVEKHEMKIPERKVTYIVLSV